MPFHQPINRSASLPLFTEIYNTLTPAKSSLDINRMQSNDTHIKTTNFPRLFSISYQNNQMPDATSWSMSSTPVAQSRAPSPIQAAETTPPPTSNIITDSNNMVSNNIDVASANNTNPLPLTTDNANNHPPILTMGDLSIDQFLQLLSAPTDPDHNQNTNIQDIDFAKYFKDPLFKEIAFKNNRPQLPGSLQSTLDTLIEIFETQYKIEGQRSLSEENQIGNELEILKIPISPKNLLPEPQEAMMHRLRELLNACFDLPQVEQYIHYHQYCKNQLSLIEILPDKIYKPAIAYLQDKIKLYGNTHSIEASTLSTIEHDEI